MDGLDDGLPAVDFDPALHSPARLKVMMILAVTPVASFNHIAKLANLTPGNLGTHLKGLEGAGYIESQRTLIELKPRLRYRMTSAGREALRTYCRQVTDVARGIERLVARPAAREPPVGIEPTTP